MFCVEVLRQNCLLFRISLPSWPYLTHAPASRRRRRRRREVEVPCTVVQFQPDVGDQIVVPEGFLQPSPSRPSASPAGSARAYRRRECPRSSPLWSCPPSSRRPCCTASAWWCRAASPRLRTAAAAATPGGLVWPACGAAGKNLDQRHRWVEALPQCVCIKYS